MHSQNYYSVTCSKPEEINDGFIENFSERIDCLILDNIDRDLKDKIRMKFENAFIICLPSLDPDYNYKAGLKNMTEPLRLSELSEQINSVFQIQRS